MTTISSEVEAVARRQARAKLFGRIVAIIVIILILRACDVDVSLFEDGSGMVSWCEPFNPCSEYSR